MKNSQEVLDNELELSGHARFLKKYGMYSATLYYKNLNEPIERRAARAVRYVLKNLPTPNYYDGQQLMVKVPHWLMTRIPEDDAQDYGFMINTDGNCWFDEGKFRRLYDKCENSVERYIVDSVINNCRAMYVDPSRCRYTHEGLHNVPDIEFVLKRGISAYREEVLKKLDETTKPETRMFEEGMLDVIEGIETYMGHFAAHLEEIEKTFTGDKTKLRRLIEAVKKVPLKPAESFYDAFVACDAAMFFTDSFETGRIDDYLYPYYAKDLAEGKTSPEEAYSLIREMLEDIDKRMGHPGATHVTVGGSHADGSPAYNELTAITIRAIGGLRSPNVTLRVCPDMPQYVWDACLYNISKGFAQPAIVNEDIYLRRLVNDYNVPYEDAVNFVFGGCSELMIQGKTACDSTWVCYNMLDIFEHSLYNHFLSCDTFEEFYKLTKDEYRITVRDMAENINIRQFAWGLHSPCILKTLLAGDCIQNAKSFSKGGTRYNFDSTNIYASTNAINSLYTVKQYYEGKLGDFSKEEFLQSLISDFNGHEDIRAKCKNVTKFGNYDDELNSLANDLMTCVFDEIMAQRCYRGNDKQPGRFMPALILWITWITCGERVGATPDGRKLGQPTADSCGPMQGTDTEGPTSVMGAALSLNQEKCAGTCILNLRLDSANFKTKEGTEKVQKLFEAYFMQGGSQLQVNVVDPETLIAAMEDPENHKDVIVRVGGFSDNFVLLDKRIQTEILKRTEHNA